MQHRLGTFVLLLYLFVLSANQAWACGDADADHVAKFHHRHDSASHAHEIVQVADHCSDAADQYDDQHHGQPCSDDESGHCHCPGCGTVCHASATFAPADVAISAPLLFDTSVQRQAFYFAKNLPEAVYLPIWQPPKLVV